MLPQSAVFTSPAHTALLTTWTGISDVWSEDHLRWGPLGLAYHADFWAPLQAQAPSWSGGAQLLVI